MSASLQTISSRAKRRRIATSAPSELFLYRELLLVILDPFIVVASDGVGDERQGVAVESSRRGVVPQGRVDQGGALQAVHDVGKLMQEELAGSQCLVEATGLDQTEHGVGQVVQAVVRQVIRGSRCRSRTHALECGLALVFWEAALFVFAAAAAGARRAPIRGSGPLRSPWRPIAFAQRARRSGRRSSRGRRTAPGNGRLRPSASPITCSE